MAKCCVEDGAGGSLRRSRSPHLQSPQQTTRRAGATACGQRRRQMEFCWIVQEIPIYHRVEESLLYQNPFSVTTLY